MTRFIESIQIQNLLSFGPDTEPLELGDLNVLIGPNGSGKSNFLDIIYLLRSLTHNFKDGILNLGGYASIRRTNSEFSTPSIQAVFEFPLDFVPKISYSFSFFSTGFSSPFVMSEVLSSQSGEVYSYINNSAEYIDESGKVENLDYLDFSDSVFTQLKDRARFRDITYLSYYLSRISIYSKWVFGRNSAIRSPQRTDLRNDILDEDSFSNLGLVLNKLSSNLSVKNQIRDSITKIYDGAKDIHFPIEGGTILMSLEESGSYIPASRLSDGTLRYLTLLAILLAPDPPPVICIEEPELGLHPDLISTVAELLVSASKRTQVIVTTHSALLIDALSTTPESILVCEKRDGATEIKRLDERILKGWVKDYGLGELWTSGQIGGNRW